MNTEYIVMFVINHVLKDIRKIENSIIFISSFNLTE